MRRSFLGRLSVFSRWNKARYKRKKRECNLNKQHFLMIWSSLVVAWFFFGLSLVFSPRKIWIVLGAGFLTKSTFANTHSSGSHTYPVRHYPIIQKQFAISLKKWRIVGICQKRELLQTLQHTFHYDLDTSHTISCLWDNNRAL